MNFEELIEEYDNLGPGKKWQSIVTQIVVNIVRKYPTRPFGLDNWKDNIDDVVSEVFAKRLIGRSSAKYIREVADDMNSFMKLMTNEIKITIELLRVPSQSENIWANLSDLLDIKGWRLTNRDNQDPEELIKLILSLPRLRNRGTERFSPLFSPTVLKNLAIAIIEGQYDEKTVRFALDQALAVISPGVSIQSVDLTDQEVLNMVQEDKAFVASTESSSGHLSSAAKQIIDRFTIEECEIILRRANGDSLDLIARVLGTSRYFLNEQIATLELKMRENFTEFDVKAEEVNDLLRIILDSLGFGLIDGKLEQHVR